MGFFSKRNKVNPDSLLTSIQNLNHQDDPFDFDNKPELVEQINTIERNLNYFIKQYPELRNNLLSIKTCYINTFNTSYTKNDMLNIRRKLKDYTNEIQSTVQASTDGYHDGYGFAIPMLGMGLISFGAGLDMLMSGIAIAAAGGPVGWIIGGAILLTMAVVFIALGIGTVVNIALANEKFEKYHEICNIINGRWGLNDPSLVDSLESVVSVENEEHTSPLMTQ